MLAETKTHPSGGASYPAAPECIPTGTHQVGRYSLRFARTSQDLDEVLKLRFEVFNRELKEGLESSWRTQRDKDQFDDFCHHMIVQELDSGMVIGTYRLQTAAMARAGAGFYSANEFDLAQLPENVVSDAIELGRACIHQQFRKRQVLFLLWRGLASYMLHNKARYFFGCCSLTSQDQSEGWQLYRQLQADGLVRTDMCAPPHPHLACEDLGWEKDKVQLPTLFSTYLRYQTLVVSEPAIDREFKTIDYLVLFDQETLEQRSWDLFFG